MLPKLVQPLNLLYNLWHSKDSKSIAFMDNIYAYNMLFGFTSLGGKIDSFINQRSSPYAFQMHGQNYHMMGSILPKHGQHPKFTQLYNYDTNHEGENINLEGTIIYFFFKSCIHLLCLYILVLIIFF